MTPPTPEQITALEQWAKTRRVYLNNNNTYEGSEWFRLDAILALCESWREMQADIDQRTQAWAIAADERDRANGEKDAAVARAEQAEADEDDLCARLNAALDAAGVDVGDEGYGAAITVLAQQRDVARAEIAHERLRYDGMRSDRDDWRQRAEQAQAEVAQARAALQAALLNEAEATIATLREQLQAAQAVPPLPDDWELVGASEYQWTFNGSRVYVSPDGATRVTGGWYPPTHLIAVLRRAMQAHPTPAQEGQ